MATDPVGPGIPQLLQRKGGSTIIGPAATRASVKHAGNEAWKLTRHISPRGTVRTATTDGTNTYPPQLVRDLTSDAPQAPWAVYLTDDARDYWLLAFDFDAKHERGRDAAAADADALRARLTAAGIASVLCASGPAGGRHVWIALCEPVPAATVGQLARLLRPLYPTLDLSPITNPATGCVRPPGAPHRDGGVSEVIDGSLSALTEPTAGEIHVEALLELIARDVNDRADSATAAAAPIARGTDGRGLPYIEGAPRKLSRAAHHALMAPMARGADASATLWRALTGAAAAHWRWPDVKPYLATAPGFEHARSRAVAGGRVARPPAEAQAILRRQWQRAVTHVASGQRPTGHDPEFPARAAAIAARIDHLQQRADACGGRWARGGGPADRRVLDVLCLLALEAVQPIVEADIRRVGMMAGVSRETARTALLRLAADGWITRASAADGPRAAHWEIGRPVAIHRDIPTARSQVTHAPCHTPATGAAERNALLLLLRERTQTAAHDAFTPPALGLLAGTVYARCTSTPQSLPDLLLSTGLPAAQLRGILDRLTRAGLLLLTGDGWRRTDPAARDRAAALCGTTGLLAARRARYLAERELWAWWQAELEWMCTPVRDRTRRPAPDQIALFSLIPAGAPRRLPRRAGRVDFPAARALLAA